MRIKSRWIVVLVVSLLLLVGAVTLVAADEPCSVRVNNTFDKLLACVTIEGVREHQAAFQAIADANGGTRAAGLPGYDGSVAYVVERMEAAGYNVTLNAFPFVFVPPAVLRQTAPILATYETGATTLVRDGIEGFIVPARNPVQMAQTMVRLALDAGLCRRMGEAAYQRGAARNTWQDYGDRLLAECQARLKH